MSKNIIVTGSTGNLGQAVVRKLITEGYQLIGSTSKGKATPKDGVDYYEVDLTKEGSSADFFSAAIKKYKHIDAGIFLVGGFGMGNIDNTTDEDIQRMFSLNFITAFHAAQNMYQHLKANGGGNIVLVGAKPAVEGGGAATLPYTISKSAVIKLAELLNETGQKDHIQTSVIIPSIIDTPPNRQSMPNANYSDWVTPESIAECIFFLISEKGKDLRKTVLKLYGNS